LDHAARFAAVCQLKLQQNHGNISSTKIVVDSVVKDIYDKPIAMRDLLQSRPYHTLAGNAGHVSAYSLPIPDIGREGFLCTACEINGRFCQVEQGLFETSTRNGGNFV
jgi:hypothetical protein